MDRITADQRRYNAETQSGWERFAPHRLEVTRQLTEGVSARRLRLCVLGAGNCNDLDLRRLAKVYAEVHLVDLDGAALAAGLSRQAPAGPGSVHLNGGIDLSGAVETLSRWSPQVRPPDAEVQAWVERATRAAAPALPGPFDVVASACVLTQLIHAVQTSLDGTHARFFELVFAVRDRHLRMLPELLAPGGLGVLVTDFVSSVTCPDLGRVPDAELGRTLLRLVQERNFFTGVNPFALVARFQTDPDLVRQTADAKLTPPWRWQLDERTYAVCSLRFRKRA
jgi:hypothetical protein